MIDGGGVGCAWEHYWRDELEELWPVICRVAALLIEGETVTHEIVRSLLNAHAAADDDQ